ncbi:hypothetical protein ElyMa_001338600 [Elysia marginata]|uniref:Uncharacterized protein n=1 Tax=Elysia marginata TaxID=1093978 RepID=A0AAV4IQV8_9GAST|nr:hypothetical protein ElyMa_001338600 [Elysia marginata]
MLWTGSVAFKRLHASSSTDFSSSPPSASIHVWSSSDFSLPQPSASMSRHLLISPHLHPQPPCLVIS